MRVLVLNPPYLPNYSRPQRSPAVTRSGALYYPIWLASCCGVLEEDGFEVCFIDSPAMRLDHAATLARARSFDPALVVMDTSTPSIANDSAMAERLKEVLPDSFILLVGTHASALPEAVLRDCPAVDAVACREYDYTVRDLGRAMRESAGPLGSSGLMDISGLVCRDGETVRRTAERPHVSDLDSLPWVSRVYARHLDIRRYFNPNAPHPMVTLAGSRGCPHQCSFCLYPQTMTGHVFRSRSIGDLLDEMEYVLAEFPSVRSIFLEDDTLAVDRSRCRALCEAILARGISCAWTANARADLDYETLALMQRAGCRMVCVGFESSDKAALGAVGKGIGRGDAERFMADARRAGVLVHGCWIFGLPGDTRESVLQTIDLAVRLDTDTAQFYPAIPYPGTAMYQAYAERGWLTTEDYSRWLTPGGQHACVVRNDALGPDGVDALCALARKRFYLRPGYLLKRIAKSLVDPVEFRRTMLAGRTFLRHLLVDGR
jgi:radical SAM superfamily enzyme YgiQ (UPF0313 family)